MITEGQFYMWRAVFAMAHVDDVIVQSEADMMLNILSEIDFSDQQRLTLEEDIIQKQDVMEMFRLIPDEKDRLNFFRFANEMAKVDGVFSPLEQDVLTKIQRRHNYSADIFEMASDHISLAFEDDFVDPKVSSEKDGVGKLNGFLRLFKDSFSRNQF